MEANAYSKYALKDLHQAIDLLDRKISHCSALETFDSLGTRETTLRKLESKRASLVKSALALKALGVASDPKFLPRSFIHPVQNEGGVMLAEQCAEPETVRKPRAPKQLRPSQQPLRKKDLQ